MKNDQQDPDSKRVWGLKKKSLSNKPKEQRILETVDRLVSRIQNHERKFL